MIRYVFVILVFAASSAVSTKPSLASDDAWLALKTGQAIAIMRHALAPGTGDPNYFDVKACETQRNLSEEGRRQSVEIGKLFKANGIEEANIFSSQWCRCLETARLLNLGEVSELPLLNSFFQDFSKQGKQTDALTKWVKEHAGQKANILVTHQVNITAYTDIYPRSGEIIIFRQSEQGEMLILKRILTQNLN